VPQRSILLIDNNVSFTGRLEAFLAENSYRVVVATTEQEAVSILETLHPEAILLSAMLNRKCSLTLLKQMRGFEHLRYTPILVLADDGECGGAVKALGHGATDYLLKPTNVEVLLAKLKSNRQSQDLFVKLRRQNRILARLAAFDELTQLYNRRSFFEGLKMELRTATNDNAPLSLVLLDLDYFKTVNDTHGHLAGDKILFQVARRLEHVTRQSDLLARYGGEEFCAVLPRVQLDAAATAAERLRRSIADMDFELQNSTNVKLTASIGLAWMPSGFPCSAQLLLQIADEALYEAKANGRDRIVISDVAEWAQRTPNRAQRHAVTPTGF
jgi:two-component system cell cycle response regulator